MRLFTFSGGKSGDWQIVSSKTIIGGALPIADRLCITADSTATPLTDLSWELRGIRSNERYTNRDEKKLLEAKQESLGRPEAVCAALIPIKKSAAWWELTQDERRNIFEERSKHTKIGLNYLPAVARRLHHCRDLSENEPFDFLTWFEYAPAHEGEFNKMVSELRATEEWKYVIREVDIRLIR